MSQHRAGMPNNKMHAFGEAFGPEEEAKIIEDFHKRLRNDNLPICPKCNSRDDVIPSILGMPTRELGVYARAGHVELLGCCPIPGQPSKRGKCKKCGTDIYANQS